MKQAASRSTHEYSDDEISAMASVLDRRYRDGACGVARRFAADHMNVGDTVRAAAWTRVAARLRSRTLPTLS